MFRIKKIDGLIFTSFLPPFFVAMMIAIFVLLMQTLWLYIDEIAGKGLGLFLVIELLAYKCVSLIPLALPIAILISSVMVMGNLAERYELSSFKSAGVPLLRIMRPLMIAGVLAGIFSYYCSNYLIPVANLKFGSRMYDISRAKPALRLDAGVFNYDFQGYAIHIGSKGSDGKTIQDILIYDHSNNGGQEFSQIIAERGEMYSAADGQYFVMNLHNGHQYVESRQPGTSVRETPFIRTSFQEWNKVFDLSEFQLSRTDEELFKSNRSMLTISQLAEAVDSISVEIDKRETNLSNHLSTYFTYLPYDSTYLEPVRDSSYLEYAATFQEGAEEAPDTLARDSVLQDSLQRDTLREDSSGQLTPLEDVYSMADSLARLQARVDQLEGASPAGTPSEAPKPDQPPARVQVPGTDGLTVNRSPSPAGPIKRQYGGRVVPQVEKLELDSIQSLLYSWTFAERRRILTKTKSYVRSVQNQAEAALRYLDDLKEDRVKHIYDMHTKYGMAVVCFIFILIGSPMGAIVRKGGFGYPILISIIFFMLFVVLTIFCRKVAESFVLSPEMAAWVPCGIMLPVGIFLTRKAMNDSKMLSLGRLGAFLAKLFKKKEESAA